MEYQAAEPPDESSECARPGQIPATSSPAGGQWRPVVVKIWHKFFEDEILERAAQLAYYWLFSILPFFIVLTALISNSPLYEGFDHLLYQYGRTLGTEAFKLVYDTLHEVPGKEGNGFLSITILIAIWASSTGMNAVISSLNKTYDVHNNRPWWIERIRAILLTLGLTFFIITALILLIFGEHLYHIVKNYYGEGSILPTVWTLAQWPITILFMLIALELARGINGADDLALPHGSCNSDRRGDQFSDERE
jgi:membrane protein